MINLMVLIEEPDAVLAAGYTSVRVYSDTSESGAFSTLLGSVSIVADQQSVLYLDLLGTSATWYKTAFYGTVPGEGEKSPAFRGDTTSSYASVLEMRASSKKELNEDDFKLQLLLDAAKGAIDAYTNHPMGFVALDEATTRLYSSLGTGYLMIDECVEVTAVGVKNSPSDTTYEAWDVGDWIACSGDPQEPNFNDTPYDLLLVSATGSQRYFHSGSYGYWKDTIGDEDRGRTRRLPNVQITARWGYAELCPPTVKLATIIQATRWLKRGESSWADAIASEDSFGQLQFRKPLDADVQMLLVNARLVKPSMGRR